MIKRLFLTNFGMGNSFITSILAFDISLALCKLKKTFLVEQNEVKNLMQKHGARANYHSATHIYQLLEDDESFHNFLKAFYVGK